MKILQILPELNVGGVETGTVDFSKYIVGHGHQSVVVSNGGALVEELDRHGAKHYQLPVHKKSFWTMYQCVKQLERILKEEKVDIVHARSRVPAWIAYFAARRAKTAFITTCHGYYSAHAFSAVMGWSKIVIAISEVIGKHMIQDFHVPSENIRVIPRSVDVSRFNKARDTKPTDPVIAIVGRITPLKGHDYFLKAMAKVVRSKPYMKVWIIGDAPPKKKLYREELEVLAKRLGIGNHVEFMGNRRDIPELLAKTDVVVLSTVTQEAFGRVILEAQAAGVPVVATKVGGVVEIIEHEKTGLLVLPKEPDEMAGAILRLLNDKKLCEQMVEAARAKIQEKYLLKHMAEATLKVYRELLDSKSILVIKLSAIGDVILTTAALKAIRERYPTAKIYCLTGKESGVILQRCPYIDGLMTYDYKSKDKNIWKLLALGKKLRRHNFDTVIDLQNNRRSHWLAGLAFPRESYGYDNGKWGFLLTDKIKNDVTAIGPVEHQFRILKMLDIKYSPSRTLELWPSKNDHAHVQELLDSEWLGNNRNFIGLSMGASAKWESKNWPLEYMARLCDLLAAENIRVILTGEGKDKDRVRRLMALTKSKPADLTGKTNILQLAALVSRCRVYVTPDSAPLHVAAAVNTPVVALFGPTDSRRHFPPAKHYIILKREVPCGPCYSGVCKVKTHACMKEIPPEEVLKHVKDLMKRSKPAGQPEPVLHEDNTSP